MNEKSENIETNVKKTDSQSEASAVSQIMGVLIQSGASALETQRILTEVEKKYLERSWHISVIRRYKDENPQKT